MNNMFLDGMGPLSHLQASAALARALALREARQSAAAPRLSLAESLEKPDPAATPVPDAFTMAMWFFRDGA